MKGSSFMNLKNQTCQVRDALLHTKVRLNKLMNYEINKGKIVYKPEI